MGPLTAEDSAKYFPPGFQSSLERSSYPSRQQYRCALRSELREMDREKTAEREAARHTNPRNSPLHPRPTVSVQHEVLKRFGIGRHKFGATLTDLQKDAVEESRRTKRRTARESRKKNR